MRFSIDSWALYVYSSLDLAWLVLGCGCLAFALAFALRPDGLRLGMPRLERAAPWALLLLPLMLGFQNLARHSLFQLTADSGIMANVAWNVAHGYGLRMLGEQPYFSVHFAFVMALLSPLLWVWNSAAAIAVAQSVAVGSGPLALFALARRKSRDSALPWLAFLLGVSHPLFQELTSAYVDSGVFAYPFFLWAAYCFETERPLLGLAFAFLTLSTKEQAPLIGFGTGLYLMFKTRPRRRAGAAVAALFAALWLAEMKVLAIERARWPCFEYWSWFNAIGGSAAGVAKTALLRPWILAARLVAPAAKLVPALRAIGFTGLLPLASGAAILPALVAWLPQQLASYPTNFQALRGHYAAFVLGPLQWAMLLGLIRLRDDASPAGRRRLIAACFAVAGAGFFGSPRFYNPDVRVVPASWKTAVPEALALIPSQAKVWGDGYLLPHLAMRHYVKPLPQWLPECSFERGLFLPDYVLLSLYWTKIDVPPTHDRILGLLRERGFRTVYQRRDLVLLANPEMGAPAAAPQYIQIPPLARASRAP